MFTTRPIILRALLKAQNGLFLSQKNLESGETVFLYLHGFSGSGRDADLLKSKDSTPRKWAHFDWLGHGGSSAPLCGEYYRLNWQLNALRKSILTLPANNPIVFVGYSMGGRLALHFAQRYPELVSSLILVSASPGISERLDRIARWQQDYQRSQKILEQGVHPFCTEWQALPILQSQQNIPNPYRDALRNRRFLQSPIGLANSILHLSPGVLRSLWDQLHQITVPTILVTGSMDNKFKEIAKKMATKLPTVRHTEISDSGHTAHLEKPEQFLELLDDYKSKP